MLRLRPVAKDDHDALLALAKLAGIGMSSLPQDANVLEQKITRSVASFAGKPPYKGGEVFLFALEDMAKNAIVGTTGIVAHVGLQRPFYSYKLSTIVQANARLEAYSLNHVLHMVNDYTGASELSSLFVMPEYRRDGIGRFVSRARHLMLAQFPHLFSDLIIAELRGVQDKQGDSPFYNHLAKHFFGMEFKEADFIYATQGGQFIADLMPRYPIYVKLLAKEAQATIGQPFEASYPAMRMLEKEGFTYEGYLDIFDAGPTVQCKRQNIATVQQSLNVPVAGIEADISGEAMMVSTTQLKILHMVHTPVAKSVKGVILSHEAADALQVKKNDEVRIAL